MELRTFYRAISRYAYNIFYGKPLYVSVEVTDHCNADCGFCGFRRSNDAKVRTAHPLKSYLPQLLELNPVVVGFVGGEPLLRKDLEDLIFEAKHDARVPFVEMTTNGTPALLTPERYSSLSGAGLDRMNISLDFASEKHDQVRKLPGMYKHLGEFFEHADRENGAKIGMSTIVFPEQLDELERILEFAQHYGVQVQLSPYSPVRGQNYAGLDGFPEGFLLRLKEKYPETLVNLGFLLARTEKYLVDGHYGTCEAGKSFLWVRPDGKLAGCTEIKSSEGSLEDVRKFYENNECNKCDILCREISEEVGSLNPVKLFQMVREFKEVF